MEKLHDALDDSRALARQMQALFPSPFIVHKGGKRIARRQPGAKRLAPLNLARLFIVR